MKARHLILAALSATALVVGISAVLPVQTRPAPASAAQDVQFDHSNCQYPERWTNPVDGCDNSDPAVPECIKAAYSQGSERACIEAYVKQYEQQQPVSNPTSPTTPELNQPVSTCGGK